MVDKKEIKKDVNVKEVNVKDVNVKDDVNKIVDDLKQDYFLMTQNNTAGRGFGNLDVSNFIRNGGSSRSDKKIYKENLESKVTFEYKFNYLEEILKPDPNDRIGTSTRKQNQLNINIR
jgi:hypothetical protein